MAIRLILVCAEGDSRGAYIAAVEPLGVQLDVVPSFIKLHSAMIETPYNGILIDIVTSIKAPKLEKQLTNRIFEIFPVIQLKWDYSRARLQTFYYGQSMAEGTLEDFVNKECGAFTARTIRLGVRKNINFNVILSKDPSFHENDIERTVTLNVSKGGCFIYSHQEWENLANVWFIMQELEDRTPIVAEVKWAIRWGRSMRIPGIGVRFVKIREGQLGYLCDTYQL